MFALIETNSATHIAIHIPAGVAADSLAKLAQMFESNATFIRSSWRDFQVVEPKMSIILGNTYKAQDSEGETLLIADRSEVIGAEFVVESPEVYRSSVDARKKAEDEIAKLSREIDSLKLRNEQLSEALKAATAVTEDVE